MNIPVLVVLVFFIEIALHYFRWKEVLQGRELPRVAAYALGVAGMMVPFTAWLIQEEHGAVAQVLWLVIFGAGAAVAITYLLDWVVDLIWKAREASQREKAALSGLKDVIDATSKGQD
ncbi:MAG: hypothetical protein CVU44_20915 [Chloroflexi bacterium HGW-Chloroflexi-6]|nr:MAG: hypothetical protein CVU44_20915 [Chloroflexi bacterium HGW-Chloroflexi-6]